MASKDEQAPPEKNKWKNNPIVRNTADIQHYVWWIISSLSGSKEWDLQDEQRRKHN